MTSSSSSGSTQPDEVIVRLEAIGQKAGTLAADYITLKQDAARAVEAVRWGTAVGKVTEFPSLYTQQLDGVYQTLLAGEARLSSARSDIQLIVSGSTSMALQSAVITTIPLGSAPAYRRIDAQRELDDLLKALTGSDDLTNQRNAAWRALGLGGAEHGLQAAHSMREVLTQLLDRFAPNDAVKQAGWWTHAPNTRDGVSKRQKLRYFMVCRDQTGLSDDLLKELETQVDTAMDSHDAALKIAHKLGVNPEVTTNTVLVDLEDVTLTLLRYRQSLGRCT